MLKKDIEWTISGVKYTVRNVPYVQVDAEDEEYFYTGVTIKLCMIKDLMVGNEISHDVDFDLVADIEF